MAVSFRYEALGDLGFGQIYRPVALVRFFSPVTEKSVKVWMIVDTGADYTILPRHFAQKLRISLERDCSKDITTGVGGNQTVYFYKGKLKVLIGPEERQVPLAFFDNNEVPALLGRLGFLETFDAEFLIKHVVVFK